MVEKNPRIIKCRHGHQSLNIDKYIVAR